MMKKYLSLALALSLLVCTCTCALVACGDDSATTTASKGSSNSTTAPKSSNSSSTTAPDQPPAGTTRPSGTTTSGNTGLPPIGPDTFQSQFRLYETIENLAEYQASHTNLTKEFFKEIVMNQSIFSGNDWTDSEDDQFQGLGKEDAPNLFDCDPNTKWCCGRELVEFQSAIVFEMNEQVNVTGYSLTTANDNDEWPDRNPVQWRIYGCNELPETTITSAMEGTTDTYLESGKVPEGWTLLDAVDASLPDDTSQSMLPDEKFREIGFDLPKAGTYKYFMFIVDYTEQADVTFQLADLTLYGNVVD